MATSLTFRPATTYEPGTVYALLAECYAEILDATLRDNLLRFDREVFDNPGTVGPCVLVSSLDDQLIGLASYDPRQGPEWGIVGHNGVLPTHRGQGYGVQQIQEILRRFVARGFRHARVSTSEHPFFLPARKMYERCGFSSFDREASRDRTPYGTVYYRRPLTGL